MPIGERVPESEPEKKDQEPRRPDELKLRSAGMKPKPLSEEEIARMEAEGFKDPGREGRERIEK